MKTHTAPHETAEWWAFTVTVEVTENGVTTEVPVTTGIETCLVPYGMRPTGWGTPQVRDGRTCLWVGGLAKGDYDAYARPTRGDEKPVLYLGMIPLS